MKLIAPLSLTIILLAAPAMAMCTGSGNFRTCRDNSGNNYSVNQIGNSTYMRGNNYQTGSQWSQNSQVIGNSVYHRGNTNGNAWNATQQQIGNTTYYRGTDANGRSFNYTCNRYGCR